MNTLTQLLIRACKVGDSEKRLKSIYKRYWLSPNDYFYPVITGELATICDSLDYSLSQFLNDLPNRGYFTPPPSGIVSEQHAILHALIYKIRYSSTDSFNGLTLPATFRNKRD